MKKGLLLVLAILIGLSFLGCGGGTAKGKGKLTIGVLFDFLSVESRVKQRDSLTEFAKQYDVNLVFQSANGDERLQLQQAENLISQGVDVITILAVNTEAIQPIILGCREAGIPLIIHDRTVENEDIDFFVGVDFDKIGYQMIDYMLGAKPEGKWALLSGAPTDSLARIWYAQWMERLKPFIDSKKIQIVADEWCDDWDPIHALRYMENILTANRDDLQVAMVMNDGLGTGVVQALEARNLAGKVLMSGLDGETVAYQRIVQGTQAMTVAFDDAAIADALIKTAIAYAKGEKPISNGTIDNGFKQVPSYLVDPVVVDKNNLDKIVIEGGLAAREDIYIK